MPPPKPRCWLSGTVWVKVVRLYEARRVAAARGKQKDHSGALWDGNIGYIDISEGRADAKVHRGIKAQHLFDRADDAVGIAAQPCQRVGISQQCKHTVRNQVNGGLVAGDEQQKHGGQKVLVAHLARQGHDWLPWSPGPISNHQLVWRDVRR